MQPLEAPLDYNSALQACSRGEIWALRTIFEREGPLLNAMVFDASPPPLRGVNLNLTLVAMQGGFFLGPLAGGLVLAACGYTVLFMLCCPLTLLALGVLTAGYLPVANPAIRRVFSHD